ncbi:MAG TPA: tetratricopeptide repeat protein [Rhizomicrobium sp.]|nr:tetratricopeptide repeat protein [Rhizomicrobium sp.]
MRTKRDPYAEGLALSAANRHAEAIGCYEAALSERPGDVRVLFALGNTASALGMPRPAEAFFRQVLAQEPQRLEALVNLANLLRAEGQFEAAERLLTPALARFPETPELWLTLGSLHGDKGDASRAADHYRKALALRPDYPPALGNLADILADDGRMDEALALYETVIARDPDNAQAKLNRAVLHLLHGNLKDGWHDYESRLALSQAPRPDRALSRWKGDALKGKRLLIRAEQGIGDQLMFASLIPELAARAARDGGRVVLECEARLADLFARSFPTVDVRSSRIETREGVAVARYDWLEGEQGDPLAIELGSLPHMLRGDLSRFPKPHRYLRPDVGEAEYWGKAFRQAGQGPWIGLCWRSGLSGGARNVQYAPLAAWAKFLRALPGTLVCAQYDVRGEELSQLETMSGRKIFAAPGLDQKNDLDRTCAMLSQLDAVVSAPTAVSWLAAGVGVATAKILFDTSWTAFGQTYEPFAPACELMMPAKRGDWTSAFAKAARWIGSQGAQ